MYIDHIDLGHESLGLHKTRITKGHDGVSQLFMELLNILLNIFVDLATGEILSTRTLSILFYYSHKEHTLQYSYNAPKSSRSHQLQESATDTPLPE